MKISLLNTSIHKGIKGHHWWLSILTWMILLAPVQASVIMRVAIQQDVERVQVGSSTKAIVKDSSGRVLGELPGMNAYYAQPSPGGGIALDKWQSGLFWIEPKGKGFVYIGDKWYRGRTLVIPTQKGITAVNWVDLEEYLYSVVGSEMDPRWPEEALKAQAIAARTFALQRREKNKSHPLFDLENTQLSQVYKGVIKETPTTYKAVDITKGKVLTYNNRPIESIFHACSGGHTENNEDFWTGKPIPYLRAVPGFDDNPQGLYAKRCIWQKTLSSEQISAKFPSLKTIDKIEALDRTPNGSITKLLITDTEGKQVTIEGGSKVRNKFILNSNKFNIQKQDDNFIFSGRGWGHGIGMSQVGAYYLASQNIDYLRILGHYYGQKVYLTKIKAK
ncbi:MAG: SpoIID/LytB domain-containing protein [Cyanobacteria bacterium P01_A01_bin.84]